MFTLLLDLIGVLAFVFAIVFAIIGAATKNKSMQKKALIATIIWFVCNSITVTINIIVQ